MQDILERLEQSSAIESSHELQCRCFDAAKEIMRLRATNNAIQAAIGPKAPPCCENGQHGKTGDYLNEKSE